MPIKFKCLKKMSESQVTSDLVKHVWEHRSDLVEGFTKRYGVHKLVWFELHGEMYQVIQREKQIKKWNRAWKIELIERTNPQWCDLWPSLTGGDDLDSQSPSTFETLSDGAVLDSRLRGNDSAGFETLSDGAVLDSRLRGNDSVGEEP